MATILVVDDSAVDRQLVGEVLGREAQWTVAQAEDGQRALASMKQCVPDIVLTDLHMPDMDGLELVSAIHRDYPDMPVVLMTAYGSESLAIEALKLGAASYVAKSQLVDTLPSTVEQVLALARADRSHKRLLESLSAAEYTFCLENDVGLIDAVVDHVQQLLSGMRLCEPAARLQMAIALDQALRNALYHGNLELNFEEMQEVREQLLQGKGLGLIEQRRAEAPYSTRRIRLSVRLCPEEIRFVVGDEGPGFDVTTVPPLDDPNTFEPQRGRGLVLMRSFMDEVAYNEKGNVVTLVKRASAPAGEAC